jgi:hypothetical protein
MRKFKLWISYLLMLAGIGLFAFAYKRDKLPYNEQGMYFDTNDMIVYHEQAVTAFVVTGVITIIVGFLIWAVTARI